MPVIAMRAVSATKHPNADTLHVYRFESPDRSVQIVANQENIYAVGDVAAIALAGTTLLDGTKLKRAKLRGVESQGMALGPVEAEVGTDLSEGRCKPEVELAQGRLLKWTSIALLHNVAKDVRARAEIDGSAPPKVTYRGKVKLHGTNAGIQISKHGIVAQGRNQLLTPESDNAGFAAWVVDNAEAFQSVVQERHVTLYGEWCGPGIQKGVAITGIDRKIFAVFAVQLGDHHVEAAELVIEPDAIAKLIPKHPDVHVLPWYGEAVDVDFADLAPAADTLNAVVEQVETKDPWVEAVFGVEGTGEGLVLYPMIDSTDREDITALMFKAKGEKHRVRKARKAVEIDPAVVASVEAFVSTFVTEARLEQGFNEACPKDATMRDLGAFLKWVAGDLQKEGGADLEAAGLTWKNVQKAVTEAAKKWFRQQLR